MFTKRIIPCLDVNNGRVVKGVNFVQLRDAGDPVEIAKAYDAAGADELVFLDITASCEQRSRDVFDACIRQGLMIRDCSSFECLDGEYIRFCIMHPEDNTRLLNILESL